MCISIPGKIILIKEKRAKVKQGDHFHWLDIASLQEKVRVGDYLIAYQNIAINKIAPKEAEEIVNLMNSTGDTGIKCPD